MKGTIDIVRDVLDNQVMDRHDRKMGRADGVVIEMREGAPPRLDYIEIGGPTLAYRLHPKLGDLVSKIAHKFGESGEPYRVSWDKVQDVGIDIKATLDVDETTVRGFETWLREKVIGRIPGGR